MTTLKSSMRDWVLRHRHSLSGFEIAIAVAVFIVVGILFPWWMLAVPAALFGAWAAKLERPVITISLLAFASWVIPAFLQDMQTGFRLSPRIAAALGMPTPVLAYLFTGVVAAVLAALAAFFGLTLRAAVRTGGAAKPPSGK